MLAGIETDAVIADKCYESDRDTEFIRSGDATAVIPPKANRKEPCEYYRELYRQRNLLEQAFNKLKHRRRIATQYDRKSVYFLSVLYLVSSVAWG